jgi:hypothetical protein
LIFTYGITTINDLAATDHAGAVSTWRAVEPVALALWAAPEANFSEACGSSS